MIIENLNASSLPFYTWNLDIDPYLNPILPPNPLKKIPPFLSHFLGYRTHPIGEVGNVATALWALITTYIGLFLVAVIYKYSPLIDSLHPPILVGSLVKSSFQY
jgi:hypothetical protein